MTTTESTEITGESATEPVHIHDPSELSALVEAGEVVFTDFHADWCGPCRMLEPIAERIAAETSAVVAKVDVDEQPQLAANYQVQGIPTMVLFADGGPVERIVGLRGEDQLLKLVEGHTN